eukprot:171032_1
MNSVARLCRFRIISPANVFRSQLTSTKIMMIHDTTSKQHINVDTFGFCGCGRVLFQQWRSCYPVYVFGNKQCKECNSGCVQYVNQQYGDKSVSSCCNTNCNANMKKEAENKF